MPGVPLTALPDAIERGRGTTGSPVIVRHLRAHEVIRVDLPNGTLRRITFDPWSQATWDENDTIDGSTADAGLVATVAADHKNTPRTVRLDVQGRPYLTLDLLTAAGMPLRSGRDRAGRHELDQGHPRRPSFRRTHAPGVERAGVHPVRPRPRRRGLAQRGGRSQAICGVGRVANLASFHA